MKIHQKFEKAKYIEPVYSRSGIVQSINAEEMGKISGYLGAGRLKKEDKIDYTAGIRINKKVGDNVKENEIIAYLYTNQEQKVEKAKEKLLKSIVVEKKTKRKNKTCFRNNIWQKNIRSYIIAIEKSKKYVII